MKSRLQDLLQTVAAMHPEGQGCVLAALQAGAALALLRIRELGGNYPGGGDIAAVEVELHGPTKPVVDEIPSATPPTLPEQTF